MTNRALLLGVAALLSAAYAALFVAGTAHSVGGVLVAGLACVALDIAFERLCDLRLQRGLTVALAGPPWRVFVRQALVIVLLLRADALGAVSAAIVVAAVLVHHLIAGLQAALRSVVVSGRMRRLETFNLDVPGAQLPPEPPRWVLENGVSVLLRFDVLLLAGLAWRLATGSYALMVPAAVVMVLLAAAVPVPMLSQALALHRLPDDDSRLRAAEAAVAELEPLVVLYFSGGSESVYQVNMWLQTMERLGRPALVLLRERRYLDQFGPTSVPVLCMPFTADLMNFSMPSVRVALYVANVGRNIHLLREPGMMSAFIGHGDSDKTASFNPATKVYDEVWVAGEAGRERYRRAQVGVRDDEIVLVGRPQLDPIEQARPRPPGAPFTVLYAPTWESWVDDPYATSLLLLGPQLVAALLATPGVRVIYKPHPLTGTVDPRAALAGERITASITAAGGDHLAVLDNSRALFDLFNESDALVSDISSVVSDYLASGKPYFVTNPGGVPDEQFRRLNPSAGAAYLVGPQCAGLAEGLAAARGADPLAGRRREVRTYLLGDPALDPMTLFRDAVDDLAARAERTRVPLRPDPDAAMDVPAETELAPGADDADDRPAGAVRAEPWGTP